MGQPETVIHGVKGRIRGNEGQLLERKLSSGQSMNTDNLVKPENHADSIATKLYSMNSLPGAQECLGILSSRLLIIAFDNQNDLLLSDLLLEGLSSS